MRQHGLGQFGRAATLRGESENPLLARAVLLLRAATFTGVTGDDWTNEGTAGSVLDVAAPTAQSGPGNIVPPDNWIVVGPDSWTGTALLGQVNLDGGWDIASDWFTDLDIEATFSVLPHQANDTGQWCELLVIPVDPEDGALEYIEFGPIFRDNGDIAIGLDFESGGETGGPTWTSDLGLNDADPPASPYALGDWAVGVDEVTVRLQVVAATGAVTLKVDGVTVCTDTIGAVSLPEPADESVVQVGGFEYVVPLKSVTLLDGIDGVPVLEFDASDLTGWTLQGTSVALVAPATSLMLSSVTLADDASFAIPADGALTVAIQYLAASTLEAVLVQQISGPFPVWRIGNSGALGGTAGQVAIAGSDDGSPIVRSEIGAPTPGDVTLLVGRFDLDGDEFTGWMDGVEGTPADASGLGAIDPTGSLSTTSPIAALAIWNRALTDLEVTALSTLFA